jgi:hypothetical protein
MDGKGGSKSAKMNIHDFFRGSSVTAGQCPGYWDAMSPGKFEDQTVAGLKISGAEVEWGVGIVPQGIGSGLIKKEVGRSRAKKEGEILFQNLQELGAVGFGRKLDGAVVGAVVMVTGRDIAVTDIVPVIISVDGKSPGPGAIFEKGGGAIAVMKVEIEDGSGLDDAATLEFFQGNDQSVESAESLPMVGTGVVETAGDGGGDSVGKSGTCGGQDGTIRVEDGRVEPGRPRKLLGFGQFLWGSGLDGADVILGVDLEKILAGNGGRGENSDAGKVGCAVSDKLELFHRHGVFPDGGGGLGMVKGFDHG